MRCLRIKYLIYLVIFGAENQKDSMQDNAAIKLIEIYVNNKSLYYENIIQTATLNKKEEEFLDLVL